MAAHCEITVVDSTAQITEIVDLLLQIQTDPPSIYIDLVGVSLSRHGSISIVTLMVDTRNPRKHIWLLDICTLGALAFDTPGKGDKTIRNILESPEIPEVFFDGIENVQLMENASRDSKHRMGGSRGPVSRKFLHGLAKCIESDLRLSFKEKAAWKLAKDKGEKLFRPERGDTYEVFNTRPLSADIIAYCAGDVRFLPELWYRYWHGLTWDWQNKVKDGAKKRVWESQSADYMPNGSHKALALAGGRGQEYSGARI
ncbi:hypothetical protein GQ43DRAFT_487132 [Delitschia confertaspora ATCC 74209]|uniref:3'-5' exonuclease domain-containing protein n=1 Tax=Delitschia confertaspora ATCC 74209 TaxID=1513339 RepID=A0A9P4MVU3_9PLEO|nr:hypothetical protein GQ43DRAFT_487132 [Delitschia confertaspora ATCC 74209]